MTASVADDVGGDLDAEPLDVRPIWHLDVVRHTDPQRIRVAGNGSTVEYEADAGDVRGALEPGFELLWTGPTKVIDGPADVRLVGHRIVHGGTRAEPAVLTDELVGDLAGLSAFAPIHNPACLEAADIAREVFVEALHVADFDTAFHTTMSLEAAAFGGPVEWIGQGVRRYGFHGISHEDAASRAARHLERPLDELEMITIHLGGGCSATAVRHGRSVDTTMGLTPTDGMVMATRSGAVDPGALVHVMRRDRLDVDRLDHVLNRESGLMGLTAGRTGDVGRVRELADGGDEQARFALDVYVRSIAREVAALRPSLDALDAVVLTGSVAEQQPWLRRRVLDRLAHLGVTLDTGRNRDAQQRMEQGVDVVDLGAPDAHVRALLVASDESGAIARHAVAVVQSADRSPDAAVGASPSRGAS